MELCNKPPEQCDVAVIGSGPSGMTSAVVAARAGLSVVVLDEQPVLGGQIYRNVEASPLGEQLGPDYTEGRSLTEEFRATDGISWCRGVTVWQASREGEIGVRTEDGTLYLMQARTIIVASGAVERPMPFPGWTLPGVMTVGSAQVLMKSAGVVPGDNVVLTGSGPLLYLVAVQLLKLGTKPRAIIETTPRMNYRKAACLWRSALGGTRQVMKGLRMLRTLRKAGIPMISQATNLRAEAGADGAVGSLSYDVKGKRSTVDCSLLLIHQGVVPNVQISRILMLPHAWDQAQRCWHARHGEWGETDIPGIYVVGDGAGIGGAKAAAEQGRLAALHVACHLGKLSETERNRQATAPRQALAHWLAVRPFLDALYRPVDDVVIPSDETIVCRCEEVTAGDIRRYVADGCAGPNQVKSFGRPGMGPCQGRMCGLTVAEVIARARGKSVEEIGYYRLRPPVKPIPLNELATLEEVKK